MNPVAYLKFLLPPFRRRLPWMVFSGVMRRLLDLVGLAAMLPLVAVILYPGSVEGDSLMATLFEWVGLDSIARFGVALGVAAVVLVPIGGVVSLWLTDIQNRWLLSIYRHYSKRLYDYYHSLGLLFLRRTYSSQLAFHINGACYGWAMAIVGTIVNAVSDLVVTLMLVSLAVWIAPVASLMLLGAMIPVLALYFGIVRNRLRRLGSEAWEARRQQSRTVQESLRGHVSINVGNSFEAMTGEFDRGLDAISEADRRSAIYGRIPNIVVQVCIAVALVVVLVAGTGSASPGSTFILLGFAAVKIMPSVMSLAASWNTLQAGRYIVDIIGEASGFQSETDEGTEPMSFERLIEMREVTFAFEGGPAVLSNVSMSFERGESVGVRGESGAGKSTLFNLLLGFYVPRNGGIYIDGVRLSPANRKSWQKIAGYVEQDVFIKNDTLARNIALSAARPDRDRIRRLLRQVGLSEWAAGLENGLDTILGEGGSTVSGGERQRIGIARALYDLPRVLFVDEATSALDPASEEEIVKLLHRLSAQGLTLFIISHRESALRHCDRIIDM